MKFPLFPVSLHASLLKAYVKFPGEVKIWPTFPIPVNKEEHSIISTDGEGVGNVFFLLLSKHN